MGGLKQKLQYTQEITPNEEHRCMHLASWQEMYKIEDLHSSFDCIPLRMDISDDGIPMKTAFASVNNILGPNSST